MNIEEKHIFAQLKLAISTTFLQNNSASSAIEDWRGDDIIAFQEDLFTKVKASVSEKWFYTYIKNDANKLPRIDMLNMLSNYAGFKNWNDFKAYHKTISNDKTSKKTRSNYLWLLALIPCVFLIFSIMNKNNNYQFCFYDSIKNEPIKNIILNIQILENGQSPIHHTSDSLGCFNYTTEANEIRFVVESPYYKTDTIVRRYNANNKTIKLVADDYALMLNYYTNKSIKEWKQHREKLNSIFSDTAEIYQFFDNSNVVEIYTKQEFIQKLTIPTRSLKGMRILDKTELDGKIVKLKFMID